MQIRVTPDGRLFHNGLKAFVVPYQELSGIPSGMLVTTGHDNNPANNVPKQWMAIGGRSLRDLLIANNIKTRDDFFELGRKLAVMMTFGPAAGGFRELEYSQVGGLAAFSEVDPNTLNSAQLGQVCYDTLKVFGWDCKAHDYSRFPMRSEPQDTTTKSYHFDQLPSSSDVTKIRDPHGMVHLPKLNFTHSTVTVYGLAVVSTISSSLTYAKMLEVCEAAVERKGESEVRSRLIEAKRKFAQLAPLSAKVEVPILLIPTWKNTYVFAHGAYGAENPAQYLDPRDMELKGASGHTTFPSDNRGWCYNTIPSYYTTMTPASFVFRFANGSEVIVPVYRYIQTLNNAASKQPFYKFGDQPDDFVPKMNDYRDLDWTYDNTDGISKPPCWFPQPSYESEAQAIVLYNNPGNIIGNPGSAGDPRTVVVTFGANKVKREGMKKLSVLDVHCVEDYPLIDVIGCGTDIITFDYEGQEVTEKVYNTSWNVKFNQAEKAYFGSYQPMVSQIEDKRRVNIPKPDGMTDAEYALRNNLSFEQNAQGLNILPPFGAAPVDISFPGFKLAWNRFWWAMDKDKGYSENFTTLLQGKIPPYGLAAAAKKPVPYRPVQAK